MLITILFLYLVLTMGLGALVGGVFPIWGPFPPHGRLGLAAFGAVLGPVAVPIFLAELVAVSVAGVLDVAGRLGR